MHLLIYNGKLTYLGLAANKVDIIMDKYRVGGIAINFCVCTEMMRYSTPPYSIDCTLIVFSRKYFIAAHSSVHDIKYFLNLVFVLKAMILSMSVVKKFEVKLIEQSRWIFLKSVF